MCFGLDSQYSDCDVAWTVSTANVLWAAQVVQQLSFGLDSQYSGFVLGWMPEPLWFDFWHWQEFLSFSQHPYWLGDQLSLQFIWFWETFLYSGEMLL